MSESLQAAGVEYSAVRPGITGRRPKLLSFWFEGTGFSDFFEQFFGRGGRFGGFGNFAAAGSRAVRGYRLCSEDGSDVGRSDILVTLEEAMKGSVRNSFPATD